MRNEHSASNEVSTLNPVSVLFVVLDAQIQIVPRRVLVDGVVDLVIVVRVTCLKPIF